MLPLKETVSNLLHFPGSKKEQAPQPVAAPIAQPGIHTPDHAAQLQENVSDALGKLYHMPVHPNAVKPAEQHVPVPEGKVHTHDTVSEWLERMRFGRPGNEVNTTWNQIRAQKEQSVKKLADTKAELPEAA